MLMNNKKIKVLIAEDDFLVSEEIVRILNKIGYEVLDVAPNGLKAIEMAKIMKPDLIFMDIKMPKLNGLEAAKIIQNSCPTPIIILTAHETQELVEEASNSGVGAYLTKPPQAEEVQRAVTIAFARQTDLITSMKLIKQLEKSEAELKDLNASKDKFFSIIAHDLRNPVSALIGYSNIMVDSYFDMDDEEKIELSNSIKQISNNVSTLLESLLEWSRFEMGRIEYNPELYLLADSINNVMNLLLPSAKKKEISVEVVSDKSYEVYADKNMVETILRNLVTNSIKFTNKDGLITLSTEVGEDHIIITVGDNGRGMSEEQIKNLFKLESCKSTTGTNEEKGSGLGLMLCKELIEKNHGKFWVNSELGKGSNFYFSLPKKS